MQCYWLLEKINQEKSRQRYLYYLLRLFQLRFLWSWMIRRRRPSILLGCLPLGRSFWQENLRTPASSVLFWIHSVFRSQITRVTTSSSVQRHRGDRMSQKVLPQSSCRCEECERDLFDLLIPRFWPQQCFANEVDVFLSLRCFSDKDREYRIR
jgi:hypothetical protein